MKQDIDDEQLMLRFSDGDAAAFEELFRRHKNALYRYFLRQCHQAAIAEELYQDVWLQIINSKNRYTVNAKFTTYLYTIAHNRLIDHYRKQQHSLPSSYNENEHTMEEVTNNELYNTDTLAINQELVERLIEKLYDLPEAQREVFLLKQEGDLSFPEIANILSSTLEAVKSRYRYAIAKLRKHLINDITIG